MVYCCEKQDGAGSGAGDQITWAGSGLGAARDRTKCRRGPRPRLGQDTGDQITGQAAGSERPETGRDAGEGRGRDWDKMPAGAEAEQAESGLGTARDRTRCRRGPRPGLGQDAGGGRG